MGDGDRGSLPGDPRVGAGRARYHAATSGRPTALTENTRAMPRLTQDSRNDGRRRRLPQGASIRRKAQSPGDTQLILRHWRDAVPDDRLAPLIKDATRALVRALQLRLVSRDVSFGHWAFLRILWESDGLTQRELSREAGVMEPTTFAALRAMERQGYIQRRRLAGNRR